MQGFNIDNVELIANNKTYNLIFQNEAMFLLDEKSNISLLCSIYGIENMEGVWVGDLKENMELKIVVLEPEEIWKKNINRAEKIFGCERFKYLLELVKKGEV